MQQYQQLLSTIFNIDHIQLQLVTGGTTAARNYTFSAQDKTWLLRIFNPEHTTIERQTEALISQRVGEVSISSPVIYADEHCLVREFIAGNVLNYADYQDAETLKHIIKLLKKQHLINTHNIQPAPTAEQRITDYLKQINLPDLWQQLGINVEFYEEQDNAVLIHNDLHHANILKLNNNIQFIDWSLSGTGDKFSDLAEIAIYLNAEQQQFVLNCYFGNYNHQDKLFHAVQHRLLLFAAWALSCVNSTINVNSLKKPACNFHGWITNILKQNITLSESEQFIDFTASCIAEFKSRI